MNADFIPSNWIFSHNDFFKSLVRSIKEVEGNVGIAPANNLTEALVKRLENENIFIFDREISKEFPCQIIGYNDISKHDIKRLFVVSPKFGQEIKDNLKQYISEDNIVCYLNESPSQKKLSLLEVKERLDREYDPVHTGELKALLEGKVLLVNWGAPWSDLYYKAYTFRKKINGEVVWVNSSPIPMEAKCGIQANAVDVFNYLINHHDQSTVVFLLSHGFNTAIVPLIRYLCAASSIISYIYDFIPHSIPFEHLQLMINKTNIDAWLAHQNYQTSCQLKDGEWVDGLLHKDGGDKFELYADNPVPKLFFPGVIPSSAYQAPGFSPQKKLVHFLGTLPHPEQNTGHLDRPNHFLWVWESLARQGLSLDLFCMMDRTSQQTLDWYEKRLPTSIRLREGLTIHDLIPNLAGQYGWGMLIAADHFDFGYQHAKYTLPSKVFSYFALGLPILVSTEFEYVCELVTQHSIGLVVERKDVDDLSRKIERAPYSALQENVIRFREEWSYEKFESKWILFLKSIMSAKMCFSEGGTDADVEKYYG